MELLFLLKPCVKHDSCMKDICLWLDPTEYKNSNLENAFQVGRNGPCVNLSQWT